MTETRLVEVPFHGDALQAVQNENGVWVSVRRVCEALGIDRKAQQRRLQEKSWAVGAMMTPTGPDGKQYESLMLHLDSLPMWLATIETRRVKPAIRSKLELYQKECAAVLARHFLGEPRRTPSFNHDDLAALIAATVQATIKAIPAPPKQLGQLMSLDEVLRRRWPGVSTYWKRRCRDLARAYLLQRRGKQPWKDGSAVNGQFMFEREDYDCIDDAVDTAREEARREEEPSSLYSRPEGGN